MKLFGGFLLSFILCLLSPRLQAQDGQDPLLYTSQALRLTAVDFPLSSRNALIPSVAGHNGFASFIDNPASMAFSPDSYLSIGFGNIQRTTQANFIQNTSVIRGSELDESDIVNNNGLLTEIGAVIKIPTITGRLVVGGGYNLLADFNRDSRFSGFNPNSSITDFYRLNGDASVAFDVFGTDCGDFNCTFVESIFRVGQNSDSQFLGIYQDAEIKQRGYLGQYTAFAAVEFARNLIVGGAFGVVSGQYTHQRLYFEEDRDNVYDLDIIDEDGNDVTQGTDVDRFEFYDETNQSMIGVNFRVGLIYELTRNLSIGGSAMFRSSVDVDEDFSSYAIGEFDNGNALESQSDGRYNYVVRIPGRYSLGFNLRNFIGFNISGSADYIDYSNAGLRFGLNPLGQQRESNLYIQDRFEDVINYRIAAEFDPVFLPQVRVSYASLPSRTADFELEREVYGLGITIPLNQQFFLDIGAQYLEFDDRSGLYTYESFRGEFVEERIEETVSRLNVLASIRIMF